MSERESKRQSEEQSSNKESLAEISDQQKELLRSKLEKAEQEHKEHTSEQQALEQANELAKEADSSKEDARAPSPAERRRGAPSKKQLKHSYDAQLKDIQADLGPGSKLISKIIHTPPVEKMSDAVGSTIARPNAMLYGSIAAFITITILYFVARHYGYQLSGFETIAAFCIGWVLGVTVDYLSGIFSKRRP